MRFLKNQEFILEILDLTFEGMGFSKIDEFAIFVDNALPGEVVKVKIIKILKNYAIGKNIEILKPSNSRVFDVDRKHLITASAPLVHLDYKEQLKFKENLILNAFKKEFDDDFKFRGIIFSKEETKYRNKASVVVREKNGLLCLGLFRKNSHDFIEIDDFLIQDDYIDEALLKVRDILRRYSLKAYDEVNDSGDIRHIVIRKAKFSSDMQIVLVTRTKQIKFLKEIVLDIKKEINVSSIIQNINYFKNNVIMGDEDICLSGENYVCDKLLGMKFLINSKSFYQINPLQTERLYETVFDLADFNKEDIVLDAYCGIGTIGILAANKVKKVVGIEVVSQAVSNAKTNAKINGVNNIVFEVGKVEEVIKRYRNFKFTKLIVDPARKGIDPDFFNSFSTIKPEKVVYVSCNYLTLIRDIKIFKTLGYKIDSVVPVDMFPQTLHVECVALLVKE